MMFKPIFIIGQPRTGSTLLQNIITQNPNIFRIGEMHFMNPWRKDFGYFYRRYIQDPSNDEDIIKMVDCIFSSQNRPGLTASFWRNDLPKIYDKNLKLLILNSILKSDRNLSSIFKILIECITTFYGFKTCCSKFPLYVNHAHKLIDWFPSAKIVHVTRDSRAIALSKTNDPGNTFLLNTKYYRYRRVHKYVMMTYVIIQYIWCSKLHEVLKQNNNYTLFRYEDLLLNPESVIKDLCAFLNIEFSDKMLHPKPGQRSSHTGKFAQEIDKSAAIRWTHKITPIERYIISKATINSMRRFGYEQSHYFNHAQ